jgi:hypothetical protein
MIIVKWKVLKAKACRLLQGSVSSVTAESVNAASYELVPL